MKPVVSIIIPVFNAEKYIINCLESINKQNFSGFEVILVNDGSTDRSGDIIHEFIKGKPGWTLYAKINEGPSAARNCGIEYATGDYIAFVDADDSVEPLYLSTLYKLMTDSNAELSCCGYVDHSIYGVLNLNNYDQRTDDTINTEEFTELIFNSIGGVLWDKLFKTSIIRENAILLDHDIYMSEDLLFILNYLRYVSTISIADQFLYNYNRMNETSISSRISVSYKRNVIEVNRRIEVKLLALGFGQQKINDIIDRRVVAFVQQICNSICTVKSDFRSKIKMLKDILNDTHINDHYKRLPTRTIYIPYHILIRCRFYITIILYSYFLNMVKNILPA